MKLIILSIILDIVISFGWYSTWYGRKYNKHVFKNKRDRIVIKDTFEYFINDTIKIIR